MENLLNTLDIDTAINKLKKVRFTIVSVENGAYRLRRSRGLGEEELFIKVDNENNFVIQHAYDGLASAYTEIITSWDHWIAFVQLLYIKSTSIKNEIPNEEVNTQSEK